MTATSGDDENGAEMVGLVVQLVSLTQDLVEAKLRLEAVNKEMVAFIEGLRTDVDQVSKAGWLELAEARKSSGSRSVSRLQLPSSEGEREVAFNEKKTKVPFSNLEIVSLLEDVCCRSLFCCRRLSRCE